MTKLLGFNEYQSLCFETRLPTATPEYMLLNLSGEVGELHSLIAKGIRDGRKFDHEQNVKKELGDILYMLGAIAADNGFTLEDVAQSNINKLFKRKEDGTLQGSGDSR